jgi:hypothetical protein
MDLESIMDMKPAEQAPKPETNIFGIVQKERGAAESGEENPENRDELDAISHVTPFFRQEMTYQTSLNLQKAQTTAEMIKAAAK